MDRGIPVSNKICFDKDLKRVWKIHEDKLRNLKGSVGKQRPSQYCFLDQRLKKGALQEIRNIQIERENRILLQKIKHLSTKKNNNSYFSTNRDVENKKKTLNEPYRKRQLVKIVQENQQIMKRIQQKKSCYNIKKLQRQRKDIEKNISLISQYPFKNYPSKNTKTNLWMTQENFANRSKLSNSMIRNVSLTYTGTRKINNNYYVVTSYLKNKTFYVELENLQLSSQKYRMELEETQARNLLSNSYNNNLEELIENLQIDGDSCYLKYQIKSLHQ